MKKGEVFLRFFFFIFFMVFVAYFVWAIEWGYNVLTEDPLAVEKNEVNEKINTVENSDLYTIHNEKITDEFNNYSTRGVYYDTLNTINAPSFYFISMGKKNTGGYSIEIIDVIIEKNNSFIIVVKESSPPQDAIVTMAYDTPVCMIEFKKLPNNIQFVNQNGEVFEHVNF